MKAKQKNACKLIGFFIALLFLNSCSLNYGDKEKKFGKRPNFIFENSTLDRYEGNKLSLRVNFTTLEIYDTEKIWTGEKIYFLQVDKNADKTDNLKNGIPAESKGFAGLIKIDDKNEKYFLGNGVFFEDVKQNINISGEAFFWDKQNNILYATKGDTVSVKKGKEFFIQGKGFIANTRSREFEFTESIKGTIKNEEEKKTDDENEENQNE